MVQSQSAKLILWISNKSFYDPAVVTFKVQHDIYMKAWSPKRNMKMFHENVTVLLCCMPLFMHNNYVYLIIRQFVN